MTWFCIISRWMILIHDWLKNWNFCVVGMRDRGRERGRPQPILWLVSFPTFPYAVCKFHPNVSSSYICHWMRLWWGGGSWPQLVNHSSTTVSHVFKCFHQGHLLGWGTSSSSEFLTHFFSGKSAVPRTIPTIIHAFSHVFKTLFYFIFLAPAMYKALFWH